MSPSVPGPPERCPDRCQVLGVEREPITADVAHYEIALAVGDGPYEEIGLHRVVREDDPWKVHGASRALMLAHGDTFPFEATFLSSTLVGTIPDDQSMAVFLAESGVDIWGIDFRWARVSAAVQDVSFMADWGLTTDVRDLGIALAVARSVRTVEGVHQGSGHDRIHLAGFSRGGHTGYAYLARETRLPEGLRNVRGFIPLDVFLVTDDLQAQALACDRLADARARLDAGEVAQSNQLIAFLGQLALGAPDDPSPLLPFLTNAQLLNLLGADVDPRLSPTFHRVGGVIDFATLDTDLLFTRHEHWFAHNAAAAAWEPIRVPLETEEVTCPDVDSPLDDHLVEIDVPVLYVGAAGGFGEAGIYNATLLASTDVSTKVIQRLSDAERAQDYGHVDLFLADDAETEVWQPILSWILAH
jgi:pimeloyl-ACP methyl ester carboxylesterase